MRRSQESSGAADVILLVALLIVGGVLGRWQNTARSANHLDPVSSALATMVSPVASIAAHLGDATGDFGHGFLSARRLEEENASMKAKLQAAGLYQEQTDRLQREIASLRSVARLTSTPGKNALAADVVGFFPRESRITLAAGKKQGVEPGMPVMAAEGLLAIVQTSDETRCQALLITSPSQKVGAMVLGHNPPPVGIAAGTGPDVISLPLYEPKATVVIGDTVVTSGFGERIPRGLIIGRVTQVEDNAEFGTRRATVAPAADLGMAREAVILR
ncbi:rod shape-determining protein MreC [soil metagenome]